MEGFLAENIEQFTTLARVAVAMLLGAVIGLDREKARKPAGLRTQMLVAGSAALLVRLGDVMMTTSVADGMVQPDPIRIVQAVILGVSFIGAGTIIRHLENHAVEGLTTAASLLLSSVIGVAVGLSQYIVAGGATIFAVFTLWVLNWLSRVIGVTKTKGRP